jgi:hypothetical protein
MRKILGVALTVLALAGNGAAETPRQVLAFYYGWYGNPTTSRRWIHWENVDPKQKQIGNSTHWPELGAYDSHDPRVVDQHCRWANEAGITGFIVTWWGQKDFHDKGLPALLAAAQKTGLNITVYFETAHPDRGEARANAVRDVLYLLEKYGQHPAWLKVNGKPVVFVYGRAVKELGLNGWQSVIAEVHRQYPPGALFIGDKISREAAAVFDGVHTYNITGAIAGKSAAEIRAWARKKFPQQVATAGAHRIACVTIIPGYDDSKLGRPAPRPITARHNGDTYRALWPEAVAANPDWILITSWNEWHEGSEIEPSAENGMRELRITAEFAPQFLAQKPRPAKP